MMIMIMILMMSCLVWEKINKKSSSMSIICLSLGWNTKLMKEESLRIENTPVSYDFISVYQTL